MPCNRCGMENERTDVVCVSCGARLKRPAKVPGAVCSEGRYTVRRHGANPTLRYRAKRGFPVMAGVLPTPPVHTASAASPINPVRRTESLASREARRTVLDTPQEKPVRSMREPHAEPMRGPAVERPPTPARSTQSAPRAAAPSEPPAVTKTRTQAAKPQRTPSAVIQKPSIRTPVRQPAPQAQRIPGPRREEPSGTTLIGSLVVAGLLLGMGGTWWATVRGFEPALAFAPPARSAAPAVQQEERAIPPVASTQPVAPAYHPYQPPPVRVPETPAVAATPAPRADVPLQAMAEPEPDVAAEAQAPQQVVETTAPRQAVETPAPKRQRNAAVRQAKKRSPVMTREDRSEEIDRLRTQAFSETRKDRLERINGARSPSKLPVSSARPGTSIVAIRRAFGECDQSVNILRREQCRWKVCGGRWGRNGCPSYESRQALLD